MKKIASLFGFLVMFSGVVFANEVEDDSTEGSVSLISEISSMDAHNNEISEHDESVSIEIEMDEMTKEEHPAESVIDHTEEEEEEEEAHDDLE